MRPPWFTERLLASFIGDFRWSEDVLGDLAEEWQERAARQGPRAASWWYRKQAARSVIHLLRAGPTPVSARALIAAALVAGIPLVLFTVWAGSMTSLADLAMSMFGSSGGDGGETLPLSRVAPAVWAARALMAACACAFIGGLLPGLLCRRAGMVQVTLLATLCIPCAFALQTLVPETWPRWYTLALPLVLALGTFAGGATGVALRRSEKSPPADGGTRVPGHRRSPNMPCGGTGSWFWRDFRIAVRRLGRRPGLTFTAVATLGLAIGANTTVFSIIDAVYLDDPPHIRNADRLVRVYGVADATGTPVSMPYPDFAYYVENQRSFEGLTGWGHSIALTVGHADSRDSARGMFVSHDYFDVLGVRPAAGRWFVPEEDRDAAPRMAAVVSHSFWSNALGADPSTIGRTVEINGMTFVVVGVAPEGFAGPGPLEVPPDVWVPMHTVSALSPRDWEMIERPASGGWNWVQAIGRLRDGVTPDVARSDLEALSAWLEGSFPVQVNQSIGLNPDARFMPTTGGRFRNMLTLMVAAAGAVLLIGTANVALLLLIRASEAMRDVAMSKALGASNARIARASLIESLVIGGLGAAVGVWMTYSASGVVAGMLPASFSVSFEPDPTVLVFACSLALSVAAVASVVPALRTAQVDVNSGLKGDDGTGHGRSRMRSGLVVAQVAVAAVLVLAAALTVRSVAAASSIPFGFDPEGRMLISATLGNHGYTPEEGQMFVRETLESMRGLPGVRAASTMSVVPFLVYYSEGFRLPSEDPTASSASMGINAVSPDFLRAMGIDLLAGRPIDGTDVAGGVPSIVVSATTARNLWPDQDPIGQRLYSGRGQLLWEVVGVAEDTRVRDLDRTPDLYGYTALAQDYRSDVTFVVDGQAPLPLLLESIYAVDPSVAISDSQSIEDLIGFMAAYYRSPALLMNVLGAISVLLAVVGLYGVLSYAVSSQQRDIGIRMALGASRLRVASETVRSALALVLPGLAIGGTAAWLAAPVMRSFLFGVEPRDFTVWTTALLMLLLIAGACSGLPARRAARLNPAAALRGE